MEKVNQTIQDNLTQIRENCNYIRVGEPIRSRGHDRNIQTYDKSGSLIPNNRSGFIGHIYCPTCGSNDYNYILCDAKTYTLEEWSRKSSEQAAERVRRMEEAIEEQERKRQEIISKINQEKISRESETTKNIREREKLEQEQRINEERLNNKWKSSKGKITSSSQVREDKLKKKLEEKKQKLDRHIRQSEEKKNKAQHDLYAYIEKRLI